jgi:hypothetical protein
MTGEAVDTEIRMHILRNLRELYPLKVDETVLISTVQKEDKEVSIEQIIGYNRALDMKEGSRTRWFRL